MKVSSSYSNLGADILRNTLSVTIFQLILIHRKGGAYKARKTCDTCANEYVKVCTVEHGRVSVMICMCTGNGNEKMVALVAAANKT